MNELYLTEIINSNEYNLKETLQHFELFFVSGETVSHKTLNLLLDMYPNAMDYKMNMSYFHPHGVGSFSKDTTLLREIVYSLYISGNRNSKRQSRNLNNLLKSNYKVDWLKNTYLLSEVFYGKNNSIIKKVLDEIHDINKINLTCQPLSELGEDKKMMKYLFKRNYKFDNNTRIHSLNWLVNYFNCKPKKIKVPTKFFSSFLRLLMEKEHPNCEKEIEVIFDLFIEQKNIRTNMKYVKVNQLDYLYFNESYKFLKEKVLQLRNRFFKEKYYLSSYFYTDCEYKLIKNNMDYDDLGIKLGLAVEYFNKNMIKKYNGNTVYLTVNSALDSYVGLIKIFEGIEELKIFKFFKKCLKEEKFLMFSNYISFLNKETLSYFKDISKNILLDLLMESSEEEIREVKDLITNMERSKRKYNERYDIQLNKDFKSMKSILEYLRLMNESRRYYLRQDPKLLVLNDKKINDYKLEFFNGDFQDLLNEVFSKFNMKEDHFNNGFHSESIIMVKDSEDNLVSLLMLDTRNKNLRSFGKDPNINFEDLENIYDC